MDAALLNPSKYLKAVELRGRDVTVTIKAVKIEELEREDNTKEKRGIIYFAEATKGWVLNVTTTSQGPTCEHCNEKRPAACLGTYEGGPVAYACDTCCGHACEDGWCVPLADVPRKVEKLLGDAMANAEAAAAFGPQSDALAEAVTLLLDANRLPALGEGRRARIRAFTERFPASHG